MLALFLCLACGNTEAPVPTEAPAPAEAPAPEASAEASASPAAATLAKADAHDGAEDKVVHECASCMLGMQGDPAYAVQHEGYELHFCSEGCQQGFAADPPAGVTRLASALK